MQLNFRILICFAVVAFVLLMPELASAAELDPNNTLDKIVLVFKGVAANWVGPLITIAKVIFFSLVLIDWVLTFGVLALEGAAFDAFSAALVKRVVFVTFGYWILQNPGYLVDLVNGFRDAANLGTGQGTFAPSDFFDAGMSLVTKIWEKFSIWNGDSWGLALVSIIILLSIAVTAAWLVLTLIEMYIVVYGGVILLGFFGSNHTKEYTMRYFGYLFSVGMKLFVISIIAGLGITLLTNWVTDLGTGLDSFLIMAGASVVMAVLTLQLPSLVQSFVAGVSGTNAMQAIGSVAAAGGAVAGAAVTAGAAAAGGAMSVAQASKLASSDGHKGMSNVGATIGNLSKAAGSDMSGRMSGDPGKQGGTMGGRMAADMKSQRLSGGGGGGAKTGGGQSLKSGSGKGNNESKSGGGVNSNAKSGGGSNQPSGGAPNGGAKGGGVAGSASTGGGTSGGQIADLSVGNYISGTASNDAEGSAESGGSEGGVSATNADSTSESNQSKDDDITNINMQKDTNSNDSTESAANNSGSGGVGDQSSDDLIRTGQTGGTNLGGGAAVANMSNTTQSSGATTGSSKTATESSGGTPSASSSNILRTGNTPQQQSLMGDSLGGYSQSSTDSGGTSDQSSDDILRIKNQQLKNINQRLKDKI